LLSVSLGDDLVQASDGVPGTIADMNWIARRVFLIKGTECVIHSLPSQMA
jgi:hypothetical protein